MGVSVIGPTPALDRMSQSYCLGFQNSAFSSRPMELDRAVMEPLFLSSGGILFVLIRVSGRAWRGTSGVLMKGRALAVVGSGLVAALSALLLRLPCASGGCVIMVVTDVVCTDMGKLQWL
jgi:hypothetical protein